jgi:ankyrin repeat protein
LERGAIVDTRDLAGRTPLSFAAESDCPAIVQLLLDAGADINSKCDNGRTPLSYAAEGGNPQVIDLLLQNRGKYGNVLQAAAEGGHVEVVRLLIESGADANSRGGYFGNTLRAALAPCPWVGPIELKTIQDQKALRQLLIRTGAGASVLDESDYA